MGRLVRRKVYGVEGFVAMKTADGCMGRAENAFADGGSICGICEWRRLREKGLWVSFKDLEEEEEFLLSFCFFFFLFHSKSPLERVKGHGWSGFFLRYQLSFLNEHVGPFSKALFG